MINEKESVKTFSSTFDTMKRFAFSILVLFCLSNMLWVYLYNQKDKEVGKKVFVVTDNGSIWATQKDDINTFSQYESRNFIKVFCNLMFAHDASTYNEHLKAALPLIHRDYGMAIKADYDNNKLYNTYLNYDASTTVQIDSVIIKQDSRPQRGAVFMKLITHYGNQASANPIAYKFSLDRVSRSDANPYGLFITSLERVVYNAVETKQDQNSLLQKQSAEKQTIDSLVSSSKN